VLSSSELLRYQRQITIPGFGLEGQEKLKRTHAFIAGVGGLGSPAAIYLAAAGIGTIRIVDVDDVDVTNLNRQILHFTKDTGRKKIVSGGEKLKELNPEIQIEAVHENITQDNINRLVAGCDLILDAVDNLETRYILNRAAVENKIPLFHGAVSGFEGRVMTIIPGQTACLMCLYRGVSLTGKPPVIGFTPGVIACIQATEVIKYLTGMGRLLTNRFLVYDGLDMKFSEVSLQRDPQCRVCGL